MDLSTVKMVVTDMDGTLLNSQHEVSARFFELFAHLQKQGIQFVAASGRQYSSMISKLDAIKNDVLFIAENGAYVRFKGETLLTTAFPAEKLQSVLETVRKTPDLHPVLCTKDNAYVEGSHVKFINLLKEYYSDFIIVPDHKQITNDVLKVAIYHFESAEMYTYPVVQHLERELKVKVSGSNWVDISHPNANKGYALKLVMDRLGLKSHEIMVFGDYNNDLEMLQLADYSFAMANAHPNVKKVARYETKDNNNYGVETILEQLL